MHTIPPNSIIPGCFLDFPKTSLTIEGNTTLNEPISLRTGCYAKPLIIRRCTCVYNMRECLHNVRGGTHPHELHPSPRRLLDSLLARFDPCARELDYGRHCLRTRRRHSPSTMCIRRRRNHDCSVRVVQWSDLVLSCARKLRYTGLVHSQRHSMTVHTGYDKAGGARPHGSRWIYDMSESM